MMVIIRDNIGYDILVSTHKAEVKAKLKPVNDFDLNQCSADVKIWRY